MQDTITISRDDHARLDARSYTLAKIAGAMDAHETGHVSDETVIATIRRMLAEAEQ